jgi:tetratricopeptide (TPR) repeat protein
VSLLMDALRRAEEAKRLTSPGRPAAAAPGDLTLAPMEGVPGSPQGRPQRPPPPSADSAEPIAEPAPAGAARTLPAPPESESDLHEASQRTAARNVFAVKQGSDSRRALWLFLAAGTLTILGGGGYFWWQLQAMGSLLPPTAAVEPAAAAPLVVASPTPPAVTEPPPARVVEPPPAPSSAVVTPAQRLRREAVSAPPAQAAGVFRAGKRAPHDQILNRAWEDWQAQRLDDAQRGYEEVLRSDPRNADALLGLAAIAAHQGQLERAQDFYQRVLQADPTDVTAQAALINLRGTADAGQSESRLQTLLAGQPDAAALHHALGNLYARQSRWSQAQEAYFQAYARDPDNADYLFNVAVSLDHLRQHRLAAQYYQMALRAAAKRPGAFDRNAAEQRMLALQSGD